MSGLEVNGVPVFRCKVCGGPCWQRHGPVTGYIAPGAPFLHLRDADWRDAPHNAVPGEQWPVSS